MSATPGGPSSTVGTYSSSWSPHCDRWLRGLRCSWRVAAAASIALASGASLLVDVEIGARHRRGQFQTLVSELDRPTTFELVGQSALVIMITGKVLPVTGLRTAHGR